MRYISKTLKFINQNLLYLLLFSLPSAVLFTPHFDATQLSDLLLRLWGSTALDSETINLFSIYSAAALVFNGRHFLLSLLSLLLPVLSLALMFSYCDRRMRIGIASFRKPFEKLNETFMPVFVVCVVFFVMYELYVFLASCVLALTLLVGHLASQILMPVLIAGFFALYLMLMTVFVQWIPIMMIPGSSFADSLAISAKSLQGRMGAVFVSLMFPFIMTFALMLLARYYLDYLGIKYIIYVLCYAFQLMYVCCHSMVLFFDVSGRERVDQKSPYDFGR